MNFKIASMVVASLLPAGQACAATDIAAGKEKAAVCAGCHGETGTSEMPTVPSLGGQRDKYLQWQLVFFRSGRRVSDIMNPIAQDLTDEEVRNLGGYFASLQRPPIPTGTANDASKEAGKKIVADHHCSACHTDSFEGQDAAPAITHQHKDYLIKALQDYRSSARPSTGVAAMTEAAAGLSDDDIVAIASYLETFQ